MFAGISAERLCSLAPVICTSTLIDNALYRFVASAYIRTMSEATNHPTIPRSIISEYFSLRMMGILLLFVILAGILAFLDRPKSAMALAAAPLVLVIVTSPKAALMQFLFMLFVLASAFAPLGITVAEVSALMVVFSALVDYLCNTRSGFSKTSPITRRFLILLTALLICGLFAATPALSIRPIVRATWMLVVVLSVARLMRYMTAETALRVFFGFAVLHSLIAVVPFGLSGGGSREFAFAPATLDDLLAFALPIGICLYLTERRSRAGMYFLGNAIVIAGLLATQSRGPIALALLMSFAAIIILWRKSTKTGVLRFVRRRVLGLTTLASFAILFLIAFDASIITGALGRFERLVTFDPSGTYRLRITLWEYALATFSDHPIIGLGPGSFTSLLGFYPELRLDPASFWVRGLTAHNLFLHFLAETGIIGAGALVALFVTQFRLARSFWLKSVIEVDRAYMLALALVSATLLMTVFFEAGWMWGHHSLIAAFFLGMIVAERKRRSSQS